MENFRSFQEISKEIQGSKLTCLQVVKNYLETIAAKNKSINAFIEVYNKESLERAKLIDDKLLLGKAGKLAGMVIALKDNICYQNHHVTASSKILEGYKSLYSATAVENLIKEDAIIIGRLNCDEFAMGSSNENTVYRACKNPHDITKVPGGSSGGSAAAVAANMCTAALGSDTGGSVRQPSAFCGVVGLKPTYSRVSRNGLIAYASSFDQIGPITHNVYDAALLLEVIAGKDPLDTTTSSRPVDKYTNTSRTPKSVRIAMLNECIEMEGLDPEIKKSTKNLADRFSEDGYSVDRISFPFLEYLIPTYYVLTTAEASSNLSRYDGVHYGYRSPNAKNLEEVYSKSRSEGFGDEVKRRIILGTFVLSSGYQDQYYKKAQKIRRLISEETSKIFEKYDFIISPTTPHTAFNLNEKNIDPTARYLEDIYTVQANLSGNPAISLPLFKHSNNMPFGVHLMSDKFKEKELLDFSKIVFDKYRSLNR